MGELIKQIIFENHERNRIIVTIDKMLRKCPKTNQKSQTSKNFYLRMKNEDNLKSFPMETDFTHR